MATKGSKHPKKREVAKLVTENRQPCVFCKEDVDDEVIYGKLYALGDIQCHYFCVLLSCCLVQKGSDSEGLFGFLYKDIIAEVERSKKHKCSYCGRGGASLGCSVSACRKQFHLPCGRRKNAVSLFYGNYKSFCEVHAPKQKISDAVMAKAKERMKRDKLIRTGKIPVSNSQDKQESPEDPALLCVICYEDVQAYPTTQTFWPPCCGRDAWLHRNCLQRMALSAGMHYLKCPLCNDKENFYDAVCDQGYYLPDRDAAWELEQDAFSEIYNREAECAAVECKCPFGRGHDELGMWDIKLCLLCGSWGMHAFCSGGERAVCASCRPVASDIEQLEARLAAVIMSEQAREARTRTGPLMPARMSLRRTKGARTAHSSSSSLQNLPALNTTEIKTEPTSPTKDRLELNLKTPHRPKLLTPNLKELESVLLSPIKMLEQSYMEKGGGGDVVVTSEVIEKIRLKFSKPKPLSAKKKIVKWVDVCDECLTFCEKMDARPSSVEILDDLFKNVFKENPKIKDPVKEWNLPRKSCDIANAMNEETNENSESILNTNVFETGAPENVENPEADAENVDINKPEENANNHGDYCDKENDQENDTNISEEKSNKLDDESSKNNSNANDNAENCNIRDVVMSCEIDRNILKEKSNILDDEIKKDNRNDDANENCNISDAVMTDNKNDDESSSILDNESSKKRDPNDDDNDENYNIRDTVMTDNVDDESSRSTFQLPSEFIAESEDSLPILDTPKKLKMVDMKQDSSIEISENNEVLNIDVVQIGSGKEKEFIKNLTLKTPVKNRMFSFKFSPLDKEPLQTENVDIDIESFKDKYLSEVDRDKSSFNHLKNEETVLRSVDINIESKKRKLNMQDGVAAKKRKKDREGKRKKLKIQIKTKKVRKGKRKKLKIKIKNNNKKKERENKGSQNEEKIKKIKLVKGSIKIKLKEGKIKKNKQKIKRFKQYVLKYSPLQNSKVIGKPEIDVAPIKRKYTKLEKSPDNLVQTTIQCFFKAK